MMSWTNRKTTVSSRGAPGRGAPDRGASGRGAPDRGASGRGAPGRGAPGTGVPGRGASGTWAPGTGVPGRGAPGTGALGSRVLAHRNPPAVAVGVWVESGTELWKHPTEQACVTERLQEETRRTREQNLCHFQQNLRLRVSEHQRLRRNRQVQQVRQVWQVRSDGGTQRTAQESPEGPLCEGPVCEGPVCEGPVCEGPVCEGPVCEGPVCEGPVCEGPVSSGPLLWPLDHTEELRKQRQAHFLMQRRMFLSKDRQNVKQNREQQKHLLKTAGLKRHREHWRLQEEQRLEEVSLWSRALETLEQRERHVRQALSRQGATGAPRQQGATEATGAPSQQEGTEVTGAPRQQGATEATGAPRQQGATEGRRGTHLPKSTSVLSELFSLRLQLRALFPVSGPEPPPLCCCGSFWESDPESCANNCPFHQNPRALVQALQTALHCWDLL